MRRRLSILWSLLKSLLLRLKIEVEVNRLDPLFTDKESYEEFMERQHSYHVKGRADLKTYKGNVFLGIDAGSTTTKLALVGERGELLYDFYSNNNGSPVKTTIKALKEIYSLLPPQRSQEAVPQVMVKHFSSLPSHLTTARLRP